MNLKILYTPDEMGENLLKQVQSEWDLVHYREKKLEGLRLMEIEVIDPFSKIYRLINTPKSIKNCLDNEEVAGILLANSIACDPLGEEEIIKSYEVLICDFAIISIRLTNYTKPKEQVKYIRENENSKVADMAKRAVYLMGLDLGMARVVLTTRRRLKVQSINPFPSIRKKDMTAVLGKLHFMYNIEEYLNNREVKLGADPEFMMFNIRSGRIIAASEFFPRDGTVGCDNIRIPNRQSRPVAELRPRPDSSPLEVAANIRQGLANANRLAPYQNVKWIAGSQPSGGFCIGGHLHFSNTQFNAGLLRALDNFIGIPVFLLEEPEPASKRRKKYGWLADCRQKDHGGFEYRTPGSWLVSQEIATAVLCLAKIVTSRYPFLYGNYLNSAKAQKAFYSGDQQFFIKDFYKLWSQIESVDMYRQYANELSIIPEMIKNGVHWDEKMDLRKAWNLPNLKRNYQKPKATQAGSVTTTTSNIRVTGRSTSSGRVNRPSTGSRSGTARFRTSGTMPVVTGGSQTPAYTYHNRRSDRSSQRTTSGRIVSSGQVRRSR